MAETDGLGQMTSGTNDLWGQMTSGVICGHMGTNYPRGLG